jgi:hypothetical protein
LKGSKKGPSSALATTCLSFPADAVAGETEAATQARRSRKARKPGGVGHREEAALGDGEAAMAETETSEATSRGGQEGMVGLPK